MQELTPKCRAAQEVLIQSDITRTVCVYVLAGTASANNEANRKHCRNKYKSTPKDAVDEIVEAYWGVRDRIK